MTIESILNQISGFIWGPLTLIFLLGVGYLGSIIGYDKALAGGLYPFIPSEFFKIGLAIVLIPSITRYINK